MILAEDPDAARREASESLRLGAPGLVCESPPLSRAGAVKVAGDFIVSGWAIAPRGLETVTVEVEGRGAFEARTGLQRPGTERAFDPARSSAAAGFELTVPTDGWLPGIYSVTISARDAAGSSFTSRGELEWWPAPEQLSAAYAAGVPALWVGEPRCDSGLACSEVIAVSGWACGPAEIERVTVELDGIQPVDAFIGIPVDDAGIEKPAEAPPSIAFVAAIEALGLPTGKRQLTITACGRDGLVSTRSGALTLDPAARHRAIPARERAPLQAIARAPEPRVWTVGAGETLTEALDSFISNHEVPALVLRSADDALAADALARVAAAFAAEPEPDLVYADHELLDEAGDPIAVALKPGWSPELLLGLDYIGSVAALGRAAAEAARGYGSPCSIRELLLSIADEPLHVVRLPLSLSARREATVVETTGEQEALRALSRRRGHEIDLGELDEDAGARQLRWPVRGQPQVSIVIPTTGRGSPLASCLASIRERTTYAPIEVILVDSGEGAGEIAAAQLGPLSHTTVSFDGDRFNFSRASNLGWRAANGEYIVFLNDDLRIESPDWLELLLGQCQLPRTGIVGARLVFGCGLIQNTGLVLDNLWPPPSRHFVAAAYAYRPAASVGYRATLAVPREVAAVTGACAMMPAALLEELGGWDESMRMDYGDVDLSLRAHAIGQRVVIEPRAVLRHDESATQGYAAEDRRDDRGVFLDRWQATYGDGDPWYHPRPAFDRDLEL